jgi:hypothetical protein
MKLKCKKFLKQKVAKNVEISFGYFIFSKNQKLPNWHKIIHLVTLLPILFSHRCIKDLQKSLVKPIEIK